MLLAYVRSHVDRMYGKKLVYCNNNNCRSIEMCVEYRFIVKNLYVKTCVLCGCVCIVTVVWLFREEKYFYLQHTSLYCLLSV